jgi:hypothetical protein
MIEWQKELLDTIERERFHHQMTSCDDLCYGSIVSVGKNRDFKEALERIAKSIPSEVWEERAEAKKRAISAQLRAEADALDASI